MRRRPPRTTRTDTLFPYTTLFRSSGNLASVDKANVLETSRLWREVTTRVIAEEFPNVRLTHYLVDAMAMHLIARPRAFDVIVTENLFGDILTDEASMLAGPMGLLRTEGRRVGKECGSTGRSRWAAYH